MSAHEAVWPRHVFTVEEIERMAEAGAFDEGPKVELLDGELVDVSPQMYPALRRAGTSMIFYSGGAGTPRFDHVPRPVPG